MANCIDLLRNSGGVSWSAINDDDVIVGLGGGGDIYRLDGLTTETLIVNDPGVAGIGNVTIDASDQIWWISTLDFSTYRLRRVNLDGTGLTTVANVAAIATLSFELPNIRYDPVADRFWYASSSNAGLWTLTKAGVGTKRYAATGSLGWGAIIGSDGAGWARWTDTVVRVDGSTFAAQTVAAHGFSSNRNAVAIPDHANVLHYDDSSSSTWQYAPGITVSAAACTLTNITFGLPFWRNDYSASYYCLPANCPNLSKIYGGSFAVSGFPPLAIYQRGDDLPTGAPIIPTFHRTLQRTGRIMQGAGHA